MVSINILKSTFRFSFICCDMCLIVTSGKWWILCRDDSLASAEGLVPDNHDGWDFALPQCFCWIAYTFHAENYFSSSNLHVLSQYVLPFVIISFGLFTSCCLGSFSEVLFDEIGSSLHSHSSTLTCSFLVTYYLLS